MIKLEQGKDSFAKYAKTFKDVVTSLKSKGTAEEILDSIIDSKFILGVNQDAFKDQLAIIFSSDKWPKMQEAIDMFSRFTNTRESVATLNNEIENGKINANLSKSAKFKNKQIRNEGKKEDENEKQKFPNTDYICVACGMKGNHFVHDCRYRRRRCTKCQVPGHKVKYCPMKINKKSDDDGDDNDDSSGTKLQNKRVMMTLTKMQEENSDSLNDGETDL
jgi:hypothetical protein